MAAPVILAEVLSAVVSARAEAAGQVTSQQQFADLALRPAIELERRTPLSSQQLSYAPSLSTTGVGEGGAQEVILHNLRLSLRRGFRRGSLEMREDATYGQQSYWAADPGAGGTDLSATPTEQASTPLGRLRQTITRESTQTSLVGSYLWTRRLQSSVALGYFWGGGLAGRSRALYPLMSGPNVDGQARYRMGPRDAFTASLAGYAYRAQRDLVTLPDPTLPELEGGTWTDRRIRLGTAQGDWSHQYSPRLEANVALGMAASGKRDVLPVAVVGSTARLAADDTRWAWQTTLSLRPDILPLQGRVDERIGLASQATWQHRDWQGAFELGGSRSVLLQGDARTTTLSAGVLAGLRLSRPVALEWGVRVMRYQLGDTWEPSRVTPFVALSYRESFVTEN